MPRFRRYLPSVIVAAAVIAIVWTIGRSGVVTQWFSASAPQTSRAPDSVNKDGKQTGSPSETARPRVVTTETAPAPAVTSGEDAHKAGADDDNSKLAALEKKILHEFTTIDIRLNELAAGVEAIRQRRPPAPTPSAWPQLEFWALSLLGLATLLAVVALSIITRSRRREDDATAMRPAPHLGDTALANSINLLLSKLQEQSDRTDQVARTLARLQVAVQGLAAEISTGISNEAGAPAERAPARFGSATGDVSPFRGPPPPPPPLRFDDRVAAVLGDFHEMAASDSGTRAFQDRWHPQSVVMANFDQRVRESGFTPELFVRNLPVGGNDEHFWFIPLASSQGYILPARRLLQHRSALRGEGAAKLFRMIFEIVPAEGFSVERPAHGQLDGSHLRVLQQGTIRLPQ